MIPVKPLTPTINWGHPLTNGLQMDWLLSESPSNSPRDLVLGSKLAVTNADWATEYGDYGLRFNASGEYARVTPIPSPQQYTRYLTVEIVFTRTGGGSGTAYGVLCGMGTGSAFGNRQWLLENDNGDGGWGQTLQVWWNSQPGIWSIPYPSNNVVHHLIVTYDGGSTSNVPTFILDGVVQTVTNRLGASGSLRTGGTHFSVGNSAEAGGTWAGNVYRCRTWNRMLTINEARELYKDPYQIYVKPKYPISFISTVSTLVKDMMGGFIPFPR